MVKVGPLRKKKLFLKLEIKNSDKNVTTKLEWEGGGVRALVVRQLKKITSFFAASLRDVHLALLQLGNCPQRQNKQYIWNNVR